MRTRIPVIVAVALAVVLLVVTTAWLNSDGDDGDGSSAPARPVGTTTDRPADGSGTANADAQARPPHSVRLDRDELTADSATLDVVSGTDVLTVRTGENADDLLVATTPDGSAVAPALTGSDGRYQLSLADTGLPGAKALDVAVHDAVAWTVRLAGGAQQETVDLRGGRLTALDLTAGSSQIAVLLPRPEGEVRIRMAGGASLFDVEAPAGIPVEVRFGGGAGAYAIDRASVSGVPGGTVVTPPDFATATDRYVVDNTAGLSSFTLTRG